MEALGRGRRVRRGRGGGRARVEEDRAGGEEVRGVHGRVRRGRGRGGRRGHGRLSNEDRERLINAYEEGEDYQLLAGQLHINYFTARSVIQVWLRDGRIERLPEGGARNIVVTAEIERALLQLAIEEPFTTLQRISQRLLLQFPDISVSTSTIARHLKGNLISTKIAGKDADVPARRNQATSIQQRYEYATWYTGLEPDDNLVYIDETGFNTFTRRSQGRAPIGEPVRRVVVPRSRNINLIMATSGDFGLLHHDLGQFTLTHERFQHFVNELCRIMANMFPENERIHIVFDNARPHLRTVVPEEFRNRMFVRQQPIYSPFFNPVEQAHSCFKASIKRQLTTVAIRDELNNDNARIAIGANVAQYRSDILIRLGGIALGEITVQKCRNWAARVNRYLPASQARQPIVD